jgi:single-strand DNA-binding protein
VNSSPTRPIASSHWSPRGSALHRRTAAADRFPAEKPDRVHRTADRRVLHRSHGSHRASSGPAAILDPEVVGMSSDGSEDVATTVMVNEVTLRGRVSSAPAQRELPSGACIVTLRVAVPRSPSPMTKGSKQASDWVDCVAWGARQRRRLGSWRVGDVVEVEGALRRRFYRGGDGTAMRLEVEVLGGRIVKRAVA